MSPGAPGRLAAQVAEVASTAPERLAVVSPRASVGYAELLRRARRTADRWRAEGPVPRRDLVAGCAVETAVAVVAAAIADVGLLLLDAQGRPGEHERVRSIFRTAPPTGAAGLGLTSSGVDGPPKCVERPWSAVASNAAAFASALGLDEGEVVLCTTPPHHSYAVCGGIVGSLMAGATCVGAARRTGPAALAAAVDRHRVDVLLSVPLLYQWYAGGLTVARPPRLCLSAGSPFLPDQRAAWERGVGWPVGEHFGTSEHGMLTVDSEGRADGVGRALAGVELTVAPGGEVVVETSGTPGRLLGADGTSETLAGPRRTGDLGRLDADGRLRLLGRAGGVINIAGNKVSAAEVEASVRGYAPVKDCAVVGDTSAPGATRLCLFVEASEAFRQDELRALLAAVLAPYKVPQAIYRVGALPRSAAGKILRAELLDTLR
ncbi:class I adenylate-forming enzyme family protein [Streptomyces globisporus]